MLKSQRQVRYIDVPQAPQDTVSSVCWLPIYDRNHTLLACTSWDNTARIWEVTKDNNSFSVQPKLMYSHDGPILSSCFSRQNIFFTGGCDNIIKMHNLVANQSIVLGNHDAPVSVIAFDDERNICISGSWDKTIKFWDCRQRNVIFSRNLDAKIYTMDFKSPVIAIGASDRKVHVLSILNIQSNPTSFETALKMQLRVVKIIPSKQGAVCGSIEGRCALFHFEDSVKGKKFSFKCHRVDDHGVHKVYPVNSLDYSPIKTNIMASAGSDGSVVLWDMVERYKFKEFDTLKSPVTQVAFDSSGHLIAIGSSYDWHKGYSETEISKSVNKFVIHQFLSDSVRSVFFIVLFVFYLMTQNMLR